ncbi:MAG: hypothetical protein FWG56_00050, partial [Desulfovibrionaceae bacterium]|nr:hypothetical protein [Desulfovibrionaceae bacterium]
VFVHSPIVAWLQPSLGLLRRHFSRDMTLGYGMRESRARSINMKSVQFNSVAPMGQRKAPTANPEVAALSGS